jgi:hypothetical protein
MGIAGAPDMMPDDNDDDDDGCSIPLLLSFLLLVPFRIGASFSAVPSLPIQDGCAVAVAVAAVPPIETDRFGFALVLRLSGVSGVKVAGESTVSDLDVNRPVATTDAAVVVPAVVGAVTAAGMLDDAATGPLCVFLCKAGGGAKPNGTDPNGGLLLPPAVAAVDGRTTLIELERPSFAAMFAGFKYAPAVTARVTPAGGGTKGGEGLLGSSYSGGGRMGFAAALPVPEGPPPPTFFLGMAPACPKRNCSAKICCCRAKTSRPLVTYPA